MMRIRRLFCMSAAARAALAVVMVCCVGWVPSTFGQSRLRGLTAGEARAQAALDAAERKGAPEVYALLKPFPKGADLHMHLSGAVYAETFIAEAVREGLCVAAVDPGTPPSPVEADAVRFVPPAAPGHCPANAVPASEALGNQALYDNLIDSFSMREFVPSAGIDGHDQFFATFGRFGGLKDDAGAWLDEVATRAAAQNEQYLEIMQTPTFSHAAKLAAEIGWPAGSESSVTAETLASLRDRLLAAGLRDEVAVDEKEFADAKAARNAMEHCGGPGEGSGCGVKVHFLYQVLRGFSPQQVFAQTLLGFEVANADPDVVGINFVMPEDGRVSMQDYHVQMQVLDYLHSVYPKVHITLHAGELAPGMVPPAGLRFHIREAVELGHAERIGHGVDLLYEDRPQELLKEMAARHVDVEVNLTSNAVILGVAGKDHPLSAYLAAKVPFSLSTDDEGVARIDLTHEYVRAVMDQGLSYAELKQSARDSLEHSFLQGASVWQRVDDYDHMRPECSGEIAPGSKPSSACRSFLGANEKAAEEWELERRLAAFEASVR